MSFKIHKAKPMSIDLDTVGIRTEYGGVEFRSRLEARWAAMFDGLHWRWSYEPMDLSGYVPDFAIHFRRAPLLVEVKPCLEYSELEENARKICLSGWRGDFMVVGARLFNPDGDRSRRSFGLLGLWDLESADGWQPADHAAAIRCYKCERLSFKHASAEWFCVACGACNPRAHFEDAEVVDIDRRWVQAGNAVQWKRP